VSSRACVFSVVPEGEPVVSPLRALKPQAAARILESGRQAEERSGSHLWRSNAQELKFKFIIWGLFGHFGMAHPWGIFGQAFEFIDK
jgi:hypothetical protein